MNQTTLLIIIAVVIVAALAAYAGWLHYRLWQVRKRRREAPAVQSFEPAPKSGGTDYRVGPHKSIYLLAEAMLDDKMTHTEACIRICAVASQLDDFDSFRKEYGVLYRVAEATAHIPILEDWRALEREEQRRYDKERQAVEDKYREAIEEAAQRLREQFG